MVRRRGNRAIPSGFVPLYEHIAIPSALISIHRQFQVCASWVAGGIPDSHPRFDERDRLTCHRIRRYDRPVV